MMDIEHCNKLAAQAEENEQSFRELYTIFFPRVYNFIFGRVKDPMAADDIVSLAWEKVFRNLSEYDPLRASFSTWFMRIALNVATDYYRRPQHKQETSWEEFFDPVDEHELTPEAQALAQEGKADVLRALDNLPERERRVITLRYWSDMSNQEIAELLQLKPNNVGVILHRALAKMKQIMDCE
jgi:RNA polymerase sigma-70 factor (ECF subfamily)